MPIDQPAAASAAITGTGGDDSLLGTTAADTFQGGAGNDTLDGGRGRDVALYDGNLGDYSLSFDNFGRLLIRDTRTGPGNEGADVLSRIEVLRFADRDVAVPQGGITLANSQGLRDIREWSMDAAPLADGGFAVVWSSRLETEPGTFPPHLYLRRFDASGDPQDAQIELAELAPIDEYVMPSIAGLADGSYVIAWSSFGEADVTSLYAQRYAAGGSALGERIAVAYDGNSHQLYSEIAALPDGGFVITWASCEKGLAGFFNADLHARVYAADGVAEGGEIRINDGPALGQDIEPAITVLDGGGFVVAWHSSVAGGGYEVFARVFDAAGAAQSGDIQLNTTTPAQQKFPDIVALAGGGFVTAWQTGTALGLDDEIVARIFDADGVALTGEIAVNTITAYGQEVPSVARLDDGGFVVSWQSDGNNDAIPETICFQRFDADGNALGTETIAIDFGFANGSPVVLGLAGGDIVSAWGSAGLGADAWATRRFDGEGVAWERVLRGTAGDDRLDISGEGFGELNAAGGAGNDTYVVADERDRLYERAGEGTDTVLTRTSWTLGRHFENLQLLGDGSGGTGTLIGNGAANRLTGNRGDNFLAGRGGADTLVGGDGSDTALYDDAKAGVTLDLALEVAQPGGGAGRETLLGIENLRGSAFADRLAGSAADNALWGGMGNDTLVASTGEDTLDGGAGKDVVVFTGAAGTYRLANRSGGALVQDANGATDVIDTETLQFGDRRYAIVPEGQYGHRVIGTARDDTLDIDGLAAEGGAGNDRYLIHRPDAVIVEARGQGIDLVEADLFEGPLEQFGITLAPNVENLRLLGVSGVDATGNAASNRITGNGAANVLEGRAGDDTLDGAGGNDTAVYTHASGGIHADLGLDGAQDTGGAGVDTLLAIENLRGSVFDDRLLGNDEANALAGDGGDDLLGGGAGDDRLDGGSGADAAVFGGAAQEYRFGWDAETLQLRVSDLRAGAASDGSDLLRSVEGLGFADGTLRFAPAGALEVTGSLDLAAFSTDGPAITRLADGGHVVVWTASDSKGIFMHVFDAEGADIGDIVRIDGQPDRQQHDPDVAALADGGFVVAWSASPRASDGSSAGVYVRSFTADGAARGAAVRAIAPDSWSGQPALAGAADGGFALAFHAGVLGNDGTGTFVRRFDAESRPLGGPVRLDEPATAYDEHAAIARLADGSFVVCWETYSYTHELEVIARRVGEDGVPLGGELQVSQTSTGIQQHPAVAALEDGGFVVCWEGPGDGDGSGIFMRRYDASGRASGGEERVNTITEDGQYTPKVLGLAGGGFVVAWETSYQPGFNGPPYPVGQAARVFDADGGAGRELRLNEGGYAPRLAALDGAGFVLMTLEEGIFLERFGAGGARQLPRLEGTGAADHIDISGAGDLGAAGGAGDDSYRVDAPGDRVIERAGEGHDTVQALCDWTLAAALEDLVLLDGALRGAGNARDNQLLGNALGNTLRGMGGADTVRGGAGADTLDGGDRADSLEGGAGADSLAGGDGADTLRGGSGNDTLAGGNGADAFRFDTAPAAAGNLDMLTGFLGGTDRVLLDRDAFAGLVADAPLAAGAFRAGSGVSSAATAGERLLYDIDTGLLYYDPDGTGAAPALAFARFGVSEHPVLVATDFVLIR